MRPLAAILAAILCFASAFGIEVDGIHKEHRPITVKHDAGDVIAVLFWKDGMAMQLGEDHFDREIEGRTVFVAPPGTYIVTIRGSQIINVTPDNDSVGPDPVPPPDPKPIPDPKPDPDPEPDPPDPDGDNPIMAKNLVFIEDRLDRDDHVEQTAVITSNDIRQDMADRGIAITSYDTADPAARPFVDTAKKKNVGVPAMFLMESAEEYRLFEVPGSIEDFNTIIRGNVIR